MNFLTKLYVEHKVLGVTEEEVEDFYGEKRKAETIVCEVSIKKEKKEVRFNRMNDTYPNNYSSEELVYVQIPEGWTNRSLGLSEAPYSNKVRKAKAFLEKINNEFVVVTEYNIMDGIGIVVSWAESEKGKTYKMLETFHADARPRWSDDQRDENDMSK